MENMISRIVIDPNICNGKPSIAGTRITVQTILGFLAAVDSVEDILVQYPSLKPDDIRSTLQFASRSFLIGQ